jgi:hypothetical protein
MAFTRCLQGGKSEVRRLKYCYGLANDFNCLRVCVAVLAIKTVLISQDPPMQMQKFLLDQRWYDLDGDSNQQDEELLGEFVCIEVCAQRVCCRCYHSRHPRIEKSPHLPQP